jgi:hypothetical protein
LALVIISCIFTEPKELSGLVGGVIGGVVGVLIIVMILLGQPSITTHHYKIVLQIQFGKPIS